VVLHGQGGERRVSAAEFHRIPSSRPDQDTVLRPGELIVAVELPTRPFSSRSSYLKVRDRASYAFALVSTAVALDLDGDVVRDARVALGGVGTRPWRSHEAEQALRGKRADEVRFKAAAEAAMKGARTTRDNAFKVELARRTLVRALAVTAGQA
jgi:xanthine dehydrogenase YagS FAD-binding subunit